MTEHRHLPVNAASAISALLALPSASFAQKLCAIFYRRIAATPRIWKK